MTCRAVNLDQDAAAVASIQTRNALYFYSEESPIDSAVAVVARAGFDEDDAMAIGIWVELILLGWGYRSSSTVVLVRGSRNPGRRRRVYITYIHFEIHTGWIGRPGTVLDASTLQIRYLSTPPSIPYRSCNAALASVKLPERTYKEKGEQCS